MKAPEARSKLHPVVVLLLFAVAVLAIAVVMRSLNDAPEPELAAAVIAEPEAAPPPEPPIKKEEPAAAISVPVLPSEKAAIAQLAMPPVKKEAPPAPPAREEKRRVVRDDPPPPPVREYEPVREARTPEERALQQAMRRLASCDSMTDCLSDAKTALALFGSKDEISTPSKVTIGQFREAQVMYRRGQADVLRTAKGIAKSDAGRKKEPELRQLFELLPQSDEWVLTASELEPIRRALDRSVRLWLRDNRLDPQRSIGMMIGILTPTKSHAVEISVKLESSEVIGDPERLREFVVHEIQSLSELKQLSRQRLARFKLVINPGGSYAMD